MSAPPMPARQTVSTSPGASTVSPSPRRTSIRSESPASRTVRRAASQGPSGRSLAMTKGTRPSRTSAVAR